MAYGDFKEVQGVASGDGSLDAKPTSTYVKKYEQSSTAKILNSPMFKKISSDIADQKKGDELTKTYVYPHGSTGPEYEAASSDKKLSMILDRKTNR